jgi:hypothetical protein
MKIKMQCEPIGKIAAKSENFKYKMQALLKFHEGKNSVFLKPGNI